MQHPSTGPCIGDPPRKYSLAVHDRIVAELEKGQRPQGACARAGITVSTFHEWIRRGKSGDPHLYQFAEDVEIAYNKFEATAVDAVVEGVLSADAGTRLSSTEEAKWILERARPDGYSKQVKTAVEGQQKEFILRLEAGLVHMPPQMLSGEQIFGLILAIYLGQSPAFEMEHKEVALLPAHGITEETDTAE